MSNEFQSAILSIPCMFKYSASPAGIKKVNHVEWGKKEGRIED